MRILKTLAVLCVASPLFAQEPVKWGRTLEFHTFSIVAVDPATRETGVEETGRADAIRRVLLNLQRIR